jgi:class 3 adenylate cyclase
MEVGGTLAARGLRRDCAGGGGEDRRETAAMARPSGTVTFLFTDIEGSTALVRRLGEGLYAQLLADHHSLIRSGLAAHDGSEVDTQGTRSSRCSPHRGRAWRR